MIWSLLLICWLWDFFFFQTRIKFQHTDTHTFSVPYTHTAERTDSVWTVFTFSFICRVTVNFILIHSKNYYCIQPRHLWIAGSFLPQFFVHSRFIHFAITLDSKLCKSYKEVSSHPKFFHVKKLLCVWSNSIELFIRVAQTCQCGLGCSMSYKDKKKSVFEVVTRDVLVIFLSPTVTVNQVILKCSCWNYLGEYLCLNLWLIDKIWVSANFAEMFLKYRSQLCF